MTIYSNQGNNPIERVEENKKPTTINTIDMNKNIQLSPEEDLKSGNKTLDSKETNDLNIGQSANLVNEHKNKTGNNI